MKNCKILLAVFFIFALCLKSYSDVEIPNLIGKWQIQSVAAHTEINGHFTNQPGTVFEIKSQEGRIFEGNKFWKPKDSKEDFSESFSGVIDYKGEKIYVVEHEDGYMFGDILSKDKIVMYYLESGEHAKVLLYEIERIIEK